MNNNEWVKGKCYNAAEEPSIVGLKNGESCYINDQCASGWCWKYKCKEPYKWWEPVGAFEACGNDSECAEDLRCDGGKCQWKDKSRGLGQSCWWVCKL